VATDNQQQRNTVTDSGLACLVMLARYHDVVASAEQLIHRLAVGNGRFSTDLMLEAFSGLGLKASRVTSSIKRLCRLPFTFTKYEVIPGVVQSISSDAIDDERRGLVYSARVKLQQTSIRFNERDMPLSAGMAVRAEVKTDRRKVIGYFLSPLQRHVRESLGER
jgi:ABC-type bacteriocin/lantibiotic exporter with double-glycine peptidase domain